MNDFPDEKPEDRDYDAALRLGRKYLYGGHEPYAPAVTSIAQMLAAYREERWHESPYTLVDARLIALNVRSVYRVPGEGTWELTTFEEDGLHWHGVGSTLEEALADLEKERRG